MSNDLSDGDSGASIRDAFYPVENDEFVSREETEELQINPRNLSSSSETEDLEPNRESQIPSRNNLLYSASENGSRPNQPLILQETLPIILLRNNNRNENTESVLSSRISNVLNFNNAYNTSNITETLRNVSGNRENLANRSVINSTNTATDELHSVVRNRLSRDSILRNNNSVQLQSDIGSLPVFEMSNNRNLFSNILQRDSFPGNERPQNCNETIPAEAFIRQKNWTQYLSSRQMTAVAPINPESHGLFPAFPQLKASLFYSMDDTAKLPSCTVSHTEFLEDVRRIGFNRHWETSEHDTGVLTAYHIAHGEDYQKQFPSWSTPRLRKQTRTLRLKHNPGDREHRISITPSIQKTLADVCNSHSEHYNFASSHTNLYHIWKSYMPTYPPTLTHSQLRHCITAVNSVDVVYCHKYSTFGLNTFTGRTIPIIGPTSSASSSKIDTLDARYGFVAAGLLEYSKISVVDLGPNYEYMYLTPDDDSVLPEFHKNTQCPHYLYEPDWYSSRTKVNPILPARKISNTWRGRTILDGYSVTDYMEETINSILIEKASNSLMTESVDPNNLSLYISFNSAGISEYTVDGKLKWLYQLPWHPNHMAVNKTRRLISIAADCKALFLFDPTAGRRVCKLEGHLDYSFSSAWHPDPNSFLLASGSQDETTRIWDIRYPKSSLFVLDSMCSEVRAVSFSPDGQTLAVVESIDTVTMYDVASQFQKYTVADFFGRSVGATFSPDSQKLFIGISGLTNSKGTILELRKDVPQIDGQEEAEVLPSFFKKDSVYSYDCLDTLFDNVYTEKNELDKIHTELEYMPVHNDFIESKQEPVTFKYKQTDFPHSHEQKLKHYVNIDEEMGVVNYTEHEKIIHPLIDTEPIKTPQSLVDKTIETRDLIKFYMLLCSKLNYRHSTNVQREVWNSWFCDPSESIKHLENEFKLDMDTIKLNMDELPEEVKSQVTNLAKHISSLRKFDIKPIKTSEDQWTTPSYNDISDSINIPLIFQILQMPPNSRATAASNRQEFDYASIIANTLAAAANGRLSSLPTQGEMETRAEMSDQNTDSINIEPIRNLTEMSARSNLNSLTNNQSSVRVLPNSNNMESIINAVIETHNLLSFNTEPENQTNTNNENTPVVEEPTELEVDLDSSQITTDQHLTSVDTTLNSDIQICNQNNIEASLENDSNVEDTTSNNFSIKSENRAQEIVERVNDDNLITNFSNQNLKNENSQIQKKRRFSSMHSKDDLKDFVSIENIEEISNYDTVSSGKTEDGSNHSLSYKRQQYEKDVEMEHSPSSPTVEDYSNDFILEATNPSPERVELTEPANVIVESSPELVIELLPNQSVLDVDSNNSQTPVIAEPIIDQSPEPVVESSPELLLHLAPVENTSPNYDKNDSVLEANQSVEDDNSSNSSESLIISPNEPLVDSLLVMDSQNETSQNRSNLLSINSRIFNNADSLEDTSMETRFDGLITHYLANVRNLQVANSDAQEEFLRNICTEILMQAMAARERLNRGSSQENGDRTQNQSTNPNSNVNSLQIIDLFSNQQRQSSTERREENRTEAQDSAIPLTEALLTPLLSSLSGVADVSVHTDFITPSDTFGRQEASSQQQHNTGLNNNILREISFMLNESNRIMPSQNSTVSPSPNIDSHLPINPTRLLQNDISASNTNNNNNNNNNNNINNNNNNSNNNNNNVAGNGNEQPSVSVSETTENRGNNRNPNNAVSIIWVSTMQVDRQRGVDRSGVYHFRHEDFEYRCHSLPWRNWVQTRAVPASHFREVYFTKKNDSIKEETSAAAPTTEDLLLTESYQKNQCLTFEIFSFF